MTSVDLQWMLIQRQSCYLMKRGGRVFSRDPNNLVARNSKKYNNLINKKIVGVQANSDNKGVVITTKKARAQRYPGSSTTKVTMNKGGRRTMNKLKKTMRTNRNRRDLERAARRKISAILRSQQRSSVATAAAGKKK